MKNSNPFYIIIKVSEGISYKFFIRYYSYQFDDDAPPYFFFFKFQKNFAYQIAS